MTNERFERNSDFIFRRIVDEAVLVPIHQDVSDMDSIYTLNDIASFIWEKLEIPATRQDLQEMILSAYDADPVVLAEDLDRFIEELRSIDAIRTV